MGKGGLYTHIESGGVGSSSMTFSGAYRSEEDEEYNK
jgi:hypothetical protein